MSAPLPDQLLRIAETLEARADADDRPGPFEMQRLANTLRDLATDARNAIPLPAGVIPFPKR